MFAKPLRKKAIMCLLNKNDQLILMPSQFYFSLKRYKNIENVIRSYHELPFLKSAPRGP
jgi:hypothetical protein